MKHRAAGRLAKKRINAIMSFPAVALEVVGDFINRATDFVISLADRVAKALIPPDPLASLMVGRGEIVMNTTPLLPMSSAQALVAMAMLTRPQDWEPPARAILWPTK